MSRILESKRGFAEPGKIIGKINPTIVSRALIVIALVAAPHGPAGGQVTGSGFSAYVTLSNDFVYRGLSQTDESAALQIGMDYQHKSGFFAGGWVSNVDFSTERRRTEPREIELDYYVGYSWLARDWSVAATLARYSYPNTSVSYDYTEVSGSFGFLDRFFYTLSYTDGLLGHPNSGLGQEFGFESPLPWGTRFAASVGRLDSNDVIGGAYDHWNVGISKQVQRFGVDVRFYDADYARVSPLGVPLRKSWVVSVSYQL